MSHTLEVRPDESLIIVTYQGQVDAREMAETQRAMMQAGQQLGSEHVFCVLDVRHSQVSFVDGVINIKEFMFKQRNVPALDNLQVSLIFVGMNSVVTNFTQFLKMIPGNKYQVSTAQDMDEALELVKRMGVN